MSSFLQDIKKIRKLYLSEKKGSYLVIQHCPINLYNPITKTYRQPLVGELTEWFVNIGRNGCNRYSVRILAKYEHINIIMTYILTGEKN